MVHSAGGLDMKQHPYSGRGLSVDMYWASGWDWETVANMQFACVVVIASAHGS
jgi:hypothetical protein